MTIKIISKMDEEQFTGILDLYKILNHKIEKLMSNVNDLAAQLTDLDAKVAQIIAAGQPNPNPALPADAQVALDKLTADVNAAVPAPVVTPAP